MNRTTSCCRKWSKSPPFSDILTGFILLSIHPAYNPIKSHSLDFKDLQRTHLILPLWSHIVLVHQRLVVLLSLVILLCLIHASGGLLFHLCGSISSGSFLLLLNHFLCNKVFFFFKSGYVRTDGKAFYNMLSERPAGENMIVFLSAVACQQGLHLKIMLMKPPNFIKPVLEALTRPLVFKTSWMYSSPRILSRLCKWPLNC